MLLLKTSTNLQNVVNNQNKFTIYNHLQLCIRYMLYRLHAHVYVSSERDRKSSFVPLKMLRETGHAARDQQTK